MPLLAAASFAAALERPAGDQESGVVAIGDASQLDRAAARFGTDGACRSDAGLGAQIAQAREAFVAARGRAKPHAGVPAGAEAHFAALLAAKDLHLLCLHLAAPARAGDWLSQARTEAGALLGKGPTDGGVAAAARLSFDRWVGSVRRALSRASAASGSAQPSNRGAGLPAMLALPASRSAYLHYKLDRDRAELTRRSVREAVERARASPGGLPLAALHVGAFDLLRDTRHPLLRGHPELQRQIVRTTKRGAAVLRCRYGPADSWPDGTPRWEELRFWHRRAPAGIAALIRLDREGALGHLRTMKALDTCPATDRTTLPPATMGDAALP